MSKHQPFLPLKEELSDRQIGPVLAIIRELQPFLLEDVVEVGGTPKDRARDGGVTSAAGTTFFKACARLDAILDDESRWNIKSNNTLVAAMIKTHRKQQEFIEVQTASAEMLQAPHYLLKPTIALAGGQYVVYYGDISVAGQAIVGKGETPQAALDDFDLAFGRTPDEQVYLISQKTETPKQPPTE